MFDKLIKWSIEQRVLVLSITLIVFLIAGSILQRLSVDVFPDLTAPTVAVLTESHGMAPEEVEKLVTFPIETAVNGASGVRRVRSSSAAGISIVWVEFDWDTDALAARQIVNEKLQIAKSVLPDDANSPVIAPMSSIMGEILLLSVHSDTTVSTMELRSLADWSIRPQLMSLKGVSQVIPIGGQVKQYQIKVSQERLSEYGISIEDVVKAAEKSNVNASGGKFLQSGQEFLIRGMGRIETIQDIELTLISIRNNFPILIKDVAEVVIGSAIKTGDASFNAKPSVIMSVLKQPNINTLELAESIDNVIEVIQSTLPTGVIINTSVFRQSDFIDVSIGNVTESLWHGAILVVIILFLFLANIRTTFISLLAIPISLSVTITVFYWLDMTINTMTLGGIAIAIGALVDDAIIDVENVYRRLRENAELQKKDQRSTFSVVYEASKEIRSAMVNATLIIMIVFLPLFFLSGVEGRLLKPMGFAYLTSIGASLFVAVIVTPVLCYYLLPNSLKSTKEESWIVIKLQGFYKKALDVFLDKSKLILIVTSLVLIVTLSAIPSLGRSFLPAFNEGSLTINLTTAVGTSLEESNNIGQLAERLLLANKHVVSVARRTGRSEMDEHAQSVSASELDVKVNLGDMEKELLLNQLRESLFALPGTNVTIGQPIGHRIDHMLSGTKANIAIKLFGDDLQELQRISELIKSETEQVEGAVDVSVEQKNNVPQLQIRFNRKAMASYGVKVQDLAHGIDMAYMGESVSKVLEGQKSYDLIVRYSDKQLNDLDAIKNTLFDTHNGKRVPLFQLADIRFENGPSNITRENVKRKLVVQANVSNRDLRSVVNDIKNRIDENIKLPIGYYIELGGQFESEERASKTLLLLSIISILAIVLILYLQFGTLKITMFIMVNLPLSLIGGIWAVFFTDQIISIASIVGFITLFGIATRNGILMISHYQYLLNEGKELKEAIIKGSLERLNPILMTALTAMFALIPLALGQGEAGKEIEAPMAIVILGGLISATALNMIVLPSLFFRFGSRGLKF